MKISRKIIGFFGFILIVIAVYTISITRQQQFNIVVTNPRIPTPIAAPSQSFANTTPIPTSPIYTEEKKFYNNLDKKQPLTSNDQQAKQTILGLIQADNNTIYVSSEFNIYYIQNLDIFQVELFSSDVFQAENHAVAWFESKGFSHVAICQMPVMFYPTFSLRQKLNSQGTEIAPIAEGC